MKKKFVTRAATAAVALLMVSNLLAGCSGSSQVIQNIPNSADENGIEKPEKITLMADTIITVDNGLQDICDAYEENTGIKLVVTKPDHNQYYEKVNLSFAGGEVPNVIEMGGTYYPNYANYGALWDMTDAWENSTEPVKSIIDEKYVDALKINGRLYGFPMAKGNGTVTYVRGDWMDELGIENPKNYDEFIAMLKKFKDELGVIPLTAAGFINTETPYTIYMREFYQDADPNFVQNPVTGVYRCGMLDDSMREALERLQEAYSIGLLDSEIVTNKTSTCRDKFNGGEAACFNYWAGSWADKLQKEVEKANKGGIVRALEPIVEAHYLERPPTAFVITKAYTSNPEGVFKYFIEYSHDGGEGQMLFTHGVEDGKCASGLVGHWAYTDETKTKAEALGYRENEAKPVEKSFYAPELSITDWNDFVGYDDTYKPSLEIFQKNSVIESIPISNDTINDENPELDTIRREVVSSVVLGKMTPKEGIADFEKRAASQISLILESLNGESNIYIPSGNSDDVKAAEEGGREGQEVTWDASSGVPAQEAATAAE